MDFATINKMEMEDEDNLRFNLQTNLDQGAVSRYLKQKASLDRPVMDQQGSIKASNFLETNSTDIFIESSLELIIEAAKERLKSTKEYAICILSQEQKSTARRLQLQLVKEDSPIRQYLVSLGTGHKAMKEILSYCTTGKEESLEIQNYLDSLGELDLMVIGQLAEQNLWNLVFDRYANYTVQKIAVLNKTFQLKLEQFFIYNFDKSVANEFSSRVMQSLVGHSEQLRLFCHDQFKKKPKILQKHISAVFLAASTIRSSKNQGEFLFYRKMLENKPHLISCKYYKRIIVSYIEKCDTKELERMFYNLNIKGRVPKLLDDKYYAYIILMLVQRQSPSMLQEIKNEFTENFVQTFTTKFAGFLLTKLVERDDYETISFVHRVLCGVKTESIHQMGMCESSTLLFIYTLLASANLAVGLSAKALRLLRFADSYLARSLVKGY